MFSGYRDGRVLVRLAAPPVEGAANDALRAFLSEQFNCPRRAVSIVSGERSRVKRIAVDGVAAADAERVITASCRAAAESASPSSRAPRRSRR